jgi:hypothetical protein
MGEDFERRKEAEMEKDLLTTGLLGCSNIKVLYSRWHSKPVLKIARKGGSRTRVLVF